MIPYINCALTGEPTTHPVVCIKTGQIYESNIIKTYMKTHDKCPFTKQPISSEDIIPLKGLPLF